MTSDFLNNNLVTKSERNPNISPIYPPRTDKAPENALNPPTKPYIQNKTTDFH